MPPDNSTYRIHSSWKVLVRTMKAFLSQWDECFPFSLITAFWGWSFSLLFNHLPKFLQFSDRPVKSKKHYSSELAGYSKISAPMLFEQWCTGIHKSNLNRKLTCISRSSQALTLEWCPRRSWISTALGCDWNCCWSCVALQQLQKSWTAKSQALCMW